jgi:predicted transposase YdaD
MAMRPQDRYKSTTAGAVSANRNYKDTVFRMLFSDKKNLLSLYNAVNSRDYTNPDDLEIVTLENAIYMGMKNDLAFIIDTNLYLYEHQSTYNPNMPLRDLFYISNEYQKLLDKKSLYSSSLQKIPAPNFIELYNGTDTLSDFSEHRLSSAFENLSGEPKLELIVTVLNINEGHNALLMEHCQTLKEYSQYVAKVRNYAAGMPLDQAVEYAVDECIKENILADFLRKNRAEVISMSIFEYDKEEEEKKLRKAEYEAGIQKGVLNTARHLLELNLLSLENISRATGLSIDELKKLQQ